MIHVLHIYQRGDSSISQYVSMLADAMSGCANIRTVCTATAFKDACQEQIPDIVHLHGCWSFPEVRAVGQARAKGARIVLTPHGQLEPWMINERKLQEKWPKIALYVKGMVRRCYAIVAMGELEHKCLRRLSWNPRVETIPNPLTTSTTKAENTANLTMALYQKVMDSDVLPLMSVDTRTALSAILKAAVAGDRRWIDDREEGMVRKLNDSTEWRRLMIYAAHENILELAFKGLSVIGVIPPDIDTSQIPCFLPKDYQCPEYLPEIKSGEDIADKAVNIVKTIDAEIEEGTLPLLHLVQLAQLFYDERLDEERLCEILKSERLISQTGRLTQILREQTGLQEGFMPTTPLDDSQTERMRSLIMKHLRI